LAIRVYLFIKTNSRIRPLGVVIPDYLELTANLRYNCLNYMKKVAFKKSFFHITIIIFFYLLIRLPLLNKPFGHDEIYNTMVFLCNSSFSNPFSSKHTALEKKEFSWGTEWHTQLSLHPPFLSIFYYTWIRIFGDSEKSLHIPTLIFGLLGLILMYIIGALLFGREVSLFATLAVGFSISHIEYSTMAVHAIFELFIFLASLLYFYKFLKIKNSKYLHTLFVLNILGVLIFYHYFFYLAIQSFVFWIRKKELAIPGYYFFTLASLIFLFLGFFIACALKGGYNYPHWMPVNFESFKAVMLSIAYHIIGR